MTEFTFQTAFIKWAKHNFPFSAAFELKICKGKSLPFSAVKPHQLEGLLTVGRKLVYKISDDSREQKPFDCFVMTECPGYVVIYFYKRGNKAFYMIEISEWLSYENISSRKSITEEECQRIGKVGTLAKIR